MRAMVAVLLLVVLIPGSLVAGWAVIKHTPPGAVGTPAHAGVVSNGKPEECVTINLSVRERSTVEYKVLLQEDQVLRGTFEANGGFGNVDIMMRLVSPLDEELLVTPRASNYDFVFPAENPGEHTFIFDNRYSIFSPKAIGLYYCVPG